MKPIDVNQIVAAMERKKYTVFESTHKPYNLNLVGIRSSDQTPNVFNDQLWVFWKNKQQGPGWKDINVYAITTDPGLFYLQNPINPNGTGILKPGQYIGMWEIGMHKTYEALVQRADCILIRDFNRDGKLDYNSGREEKGKFGINLHHAGEDSATVDKFSAACQVFKRKADFNEFMDLARKARGFWGGVFTYTLMDEEEI